MSASRRRFLISSSAALAGLAMRPLSGLGRPLPSPLLVERAAYTMGSIVTFKAYCFDTDRCDRAIDDAIREMKQIDKIMSVFDNESQLSRVNRHAAESGVEVDGRIIEHRDYWNPATFDRQVKI